MAGLSTYFIEQGYSQGISQEITEGISQGEELGIAKCIHHLMAKQHFTFEAAAEFLEITEEDRTACLEKMKELGYLL